MRTENINIDYISNMTFLEEGISNWEYRDATPKKMFLGIIRIKKEKPKGFYNTSWDEDYYPSKESLEKNEKELYYNGIRVMRKACVIIKMFNKNEFVEYWGSNKLAESRIQELKQKTKHTFIELENVERYY